MRGEILEGVQCAACGSYEFECRDEDLYCITHEEAAKEVDKTIMQPDR